MLQGIKLYAAGALVLAVFAGGWTINGWRLGQKIGRLEIDLETAKAANAQLSGLIEEQHAAYRELVLEGERLKDRLAVAEAQSGQVEVRWRERIREIVRDAPPASASCEEAVLWARVQYAALSSSWF